MKFLSIVIFDLYDQIIQYIIYNFVFYIRENFMFTTFMLPLFIFTTTKETFSKISSSLSGKRLLYNKKN